MMGNFDGGRRLMDREHIKPKNVFSTLGRFFSYFGARKIALLFVLLFVVLNTWSQVLVPEIMGQAVDCYLLPIPSSVCTYTTRDAAAIDADTALTDAGKVDAKLPGLLTIVLN